ncbi:MAG: methylcobalamin:coenzyme M methyltransferase [Planctomycetes bacterium ADurb.Bin126]|nr:MAG: methylcobalamin:coenzyme M methyltransferase [Planctomycetes bacterium ADurb.Bin126]HOD82890.1 uroporphyrinogen decarboxylase family protein [Phycisphaerae bacterium]HQL73742.1 uroporphyrinogen decarboxylase family protein [Phycisphaerae bacterium]
MTRRERLLATLAGRPVDRPAVSFYEIGGFPVDPSDPDEFNVYNSPDWQPLLELAETQTDLIRMRPAALRPAYPSVRDRFVEITNWTEGRSRFTRTTVRAGGRTLTGLSRRDADVDTVWEVEHLLKDSDDLRAFLELDDQALEFEPDATPILEADREVGDRGIVMIDQEDPLCAAAQLLSMEDYTVTALCESDLFERLVEKLAGPIYRRAAKVAAAAPDRLWRIYGPEYAAEPYLPPRLFERYVVGYTQPLVKTVHDSGGWARIHCHGRLRAILPMIADMGADAIDPIEPPPRGDMELADVRRQYGQRLVLFGNLEIADIETFAPERFEQVVRSSLREGTSGEGRGFVLLPSASPYGRTITERTLANYRTMVREITTSA